jgi:hypothetical protein
MGIMLDLEVYDIVRIERNDGSVYLESVNSINPQRHIGETDHFDINYITLKVDSCFGDDEDMTYKLTNVWHLNTTNGNYMLIWENGKELKDDNKPYDCRPSDVSWEKHQKTLVENAELKDIIVELNKEINAMKKGYTK